MKLDSPLADEQRPPEDSMSVEEKLDEIIRLLKERPQVVHVHEASRIPLFPQRPKCTCRTNLPGRHSYGCPLHKRPQVMG